MERNPCLHGLRGALAFALLLFHVVNSGLPSFDGPVADGAHFVLASLEHGVDLFFVISGIVIVFAFRKSSTPLQFMRNRALRIFPVLWVTVITIAALSHFDLRHTKPTDPLTIAANLLALPPVLPFRLIHPAAWSISYEMIFYAMFVLFALLDRAASRRSATVVVALVGAALILAHVRAACFLIGVAIAMAAEGSKGIEHRRGGRLLINHAGIWLLLSLLAWQLCFEDLRLQLPSGYELIGRPVALAIFAFAFVCAAIGMAAVFHGRGAFARWLCLRPMQWLGTISFSLYLWQTLTMAIVKSGMVRTGLPELLGPWSQLAFFALSLPPTLIVSHWSQRWIEDRFTRRLRVWFAPRGARQASPAAHITERPAP
jgi:peptidoglycan/LPS O-acetylase OafA/YrhL